MIVGIISDFVYYLIPQVGKMHIYQRFLLPANLLFALMLALMLKAVVVARPLIALRLVLAVLLLATVATAYILSLIHI